ncbi:MAG: serine hydrolase [Bacteroidota bacterium]
MKLKHIITYKRILLLISILCTLILVWLLILNPPKKTIPTEISPNTVPFLENNSKWADSLIRIMSPEEKAAQLLMIAISATGIDKMQTTKDIIKTTKCGGVYINKGAIHNLSATTSELQKTASVPILCAVQAPAGLYSADDSVASCSQLPDINFMQNDNLLADLAYVTSQQMKHCGLQINFMLSLSSVNQNRDTPLDESYAFFAYRLHKKAMFLLDKVQKNHLLLCALGMDCKQTLPSSIRIPTRYDTLRRLPLLKMINKGLSGLWIENGKTKLADSVQKTYKFQGLLFSELPNDTKREENAVKLLNSGCDMLIIPSNQIQQLESLIAAICQGKIADLDKKVKKILLAKSWTRLNKPVKTNSDSASFYCNYWKSRLVHRRAIESAVVLLNNQKNRIPFKNLETEKIILLQIGNTASRYFSDEINHYATIQSIQLNFAASDASIDAIQARLKPYSAVIISVFEDALFMNPERIKKLQTLIITVTSKQPAILVVYGDMQFLSNFTRTPCMLWSYSPCPMAQQTVAQIIFGGDVTNSCLPYSCSQEFCSNDGLAIKNAIRFKYTTAEDAGVDGSKLYKIDSIAQSAIRLGAFPGCQVFFARNGKVFFNKSYGTHTYDKNEKVNNSDLYDIASVTKVAATTIALMYLYDKGVIKLDSTLNFYFDDLDKNERGKKVRISKLNYITLRDLLTHKSGLPEGLPVGLFISPKRALAAMKKRLKEQARGKIENDTLKEQQEEQGYYTNIDTSLIRSDQDSLLKLIYSNTRMADYTIEIAKDLYLRNGIVDSLWQLAKQTSMRKSKNYLYSDMNLYLVMKVVEKVAKMPLDKFMEQSFFKVLNLCRIGFNPLNQFRKEEIAPTEAETFFRKQLIRGYVHDPMAALLGGIGGNAGLFSNAHELGVLMQMLLNKGTYGGIRFFSDNTVTLFTSAQNGTYRGLGFDRKGKTDAKMIARGASLKTFGHTGFTGTCIWVDPEYKLVYVFLSNRVHPKSSNQKINNYHIRQNIQQVVYEAMVN